MRPDRYCPLSALPYFDLCSNPVSDLVLESDLESDLDLESGLGPALESALDLGLGPVLESALDPGLDLVSGLVSGLVSDRYPFPV